MPQTVPATCVLGPGKTGLTIGLRVLNLDGSTYAPFATTGVAETATAGTYRKAGGVVAPLAGGYIVWGTALVDYAEATVDSAAIITDILEDTGTTLPGLIATVGPGAGSVTWTYTLLSDVDNTTPVPQARIEIYTDEAMTNLIRQGYTNDFGIATFYLDPGTYYVRRTKAGWDFTNPDTEIVEEPSP